ncbi:MAG: hypothetical protein JWR58_4362 [Pseudonocardia sp.]|nr:hypothetical protein [Pseudonocardia sp.]
MTRMSRRTLVAAGAIVAVAGLSFVGLSAEAGAAAQPSRAAPSSGTGTRMPTDSIGTYDPQNHSDATFYASVLKGANEVPVTSGPKVGDKNGSATALMRIQGDQVSYAFMWTGIGTPTMGHIHEGPTGANGDVQIPFFGSKLPAGRNSVIGTVKVTNKDLLANLKTHPEQFYFNLHTAAFPGGAVRGQVHALPEKLNLQAAMTADQVHSVVRGAQIYACTRQNDGSFKFTQNNVDATLGGGIRHTFLKAGPAGPPQWVAPDGSGVTGKALTMIPNGGKNIPELVLAATPEGRPGGELSSTQIVMRLNTVGGVAPAGTCNPAAQPKAAVPYTADYLFVTSK